MKQIGQGNGRRRNNGRRFQVRLVCRLNPDLKEDRAIIAALDSCRRGERSAFVRGALYAFLCGESAPPAIVPPPPADLPLPPAPSFFAGGARNGREDGGAFVGESGWRQGGRQEHDPRSNPDVSTSQAGGLGGTEGMVSRPPPGGMDTAKAKRGGDEIVPSSSGGGGGKTAAALKGLFG